MTQGETLFYLREIRTHWCTSNVSPDKLAELEAAKLIERNSEPVPTVRLTAEGARQKIAGRPRDAVSRISLTQRNLTRQKRKFRRSSGHTHVPRAKPLE